jgi:hypothetical protein
MIASLPEKARDQEYWPVTTHLASSARLAANRARSRTAGSGLAAAAKISCISFLLALVLMAVSPFGGNTENIAA